MGRFKNSPGSKLGMVWLIVAFAGYRGLMLWHAFRDGAGWLGCALFHRGSHRLLWSNKPAGKTTWLCLACDREWEK